MKRRVWVVETRWSPDEPWEPTETISLSMAVYLTREAARRDIYNGQIAHGYPNQIRVVSYTPEASR